MKPEASATKPELSTEMLILPDGKILAHNLTPVMAALLAGLNPADEPMRERAAPARHADEPSALPPPTEH